jgi:hypothetical protein
VANAWSTSVPGAAVFPGFALDVRVDSETIYVPMFGIIGAFSPGSSMGADLPKQRRLELGTLTYGALLLPGLGVHFNDAGGDGVRLSISARAIYSAFHTTGTATSVNGEESLEGRGVHGWGVLAGAELCRDVIGKRRGLCAFLQGTQAYTAGLQHALTGGFRVVF